MDALRRLVGTASPGHPPAKEGDHVYPLHMLDDTPTLRGIVVLWTLQFHEVLSPEKLRVSLTSLLEIGDWKKLGGRLRINANGELEIFVPREFTTEHPAIAFSNVQTGTKISDHSLGKKLPQATGSASIHEGPEIFRPFSYRDDAPKTLQDYIDRQCPQLSLHVVSFDDATLVSLSWPHTLMDVMGQQALVHSWSLVLAGRISDVPPLLGAREDFLCAAADKEDSPRESFKLEDKKLTGLSMASFGARFMWDLLWNQTVETKTMCLPQDAIARLRNQAQAELQEHNDSGEAPFISDGDVITAWMAREIASSLPQPRPVTLLHALNSRFRVPSIKQAAGVFVQNMAVGAFTFLSAEAAVGPLGPIALENRRHLAEQSTEAQILAVVRQLQDQPKLTSDASFVCGDPGAVLMPFTNWTRADFFNTIDFGPAVLGRGDADPTRSNRPGTIVNHHALSMQPSMATRNVVVITGKDQTDNYWITAMLLPAAWARIEKSIKEL